MGAEGSFKKLKTRKQTKKRGEEDAGMGSSQLAQTETNSYRANEGQKKDKVKKKKKSSVDIAEKVNGVMVGLHNVKANETQESSEGNKKRKKVRSGKRKNDKKNRTETKEFDIPDSNEADERVCGEKDVKNELAEDKSQKSRKKKRKNAESVNKVVDEPKLQNEEMAITESKPEGDAAEPRGLDKADTERNSKTGKSKRHGKAKKKSHLVTNESSLDNLLERKGDAEDEAYLMSSGDEDCSKGMKKWIMEYHQSRPGIKLLQEKIDDFIMAHEAKEEQARAEREAQAAEGGWTVVVHHKGRKKTTDAESGIAVGSVAQAAVLDKMAKKKKNEVGLDFYRFQKREAHRNEIMMLQSKFEQDKKRIQQMRAARKFRPY